MQTDYPYAQVHSTKPIPRLTKKGFVVRIALSVILEAGFMLLCALCLSKPLPINLPLSLSNAKASFTVISILWQLVVTFPLGGIVNHCFSGEWYFQLTGTGNLIPGQSDFVSTLTAGMLDYVTYASKPQASARFRVAFIIMLLSIVIRSIIPGSLSPASVLQEEPTKIQVAQTTMNFTAQGESSFEHDSWREIWISRASMIAQLEQEKVVTFGLKNPSNRMVGWPTTLAKDLEGRLRYPTDMVHFDYKCNWETPEILHNSEFSLGPVSGSNQKYIIQEAVLFPIRMERDNNDYRIAFLIGGHNSQAPFTGVPALGFTLDLDGLPTFNHSTLERKFDFLPKFFDSLNLSLGAPALALLVCDPHIEYSGGEIQLDPNGSLIVTHDYGPLIGNIDNSTTFFRLLFQDTLSTFFSPEFRADQTFTFPAQQTFLPLGIIPKVNSSSDPLIPLLSPEEISSNLNGVATSITKSYSTGAIIGESFGMPTSLVLDINGWIEKEKLVLATNSRLFWINIGLWVVTICLLGWLGWLIDWKAMTPFALEGILDILKNQKV